MEFAKINEDIEKHKRECNNFDDIDVQKCINLLNMKNIEINDTYYRAIKDKPPRDSDFLPAYREPGRPYIPPKNETSFCMFHGVSVLNSKKSTTNVLKKIFSHYRVNPGNKRIRDYKFICKFKFYEDAGVIGKTSKNHFTFYPADSFNVNNLTILDIEDIKEEEIFKKLKRKEQDESF